MDCCYQEGKEKRERERGWLVSKGSSNESKEERSEKNVRKVGGS